MATQFVANVRPWVSSDRIEAYRPVVGTDREMIANYLYNMALNEALYTPLSLLEVTLRNTLHASIARYFGSSTWYDLSGVLAFVQANDVAKVKRRITGLGKTITPGRVVSELNFGFWVSMLSGAYEATIWRPNNSRVLKGAFLNVPRPLRQRNTIYVRYNHLRELRNRVFHHESIWNRPTLWQEYEQMYEAIDWISPDMVAMCRMVDRFDHFFHNGKVEIDTMLTNSGIT
jgi:hypothetical protein